MNPQFKVFVGTELVRTVSDKNRACETAREECAARGVAAQVVQTSPTTVYEVVPEEINGASL